MKVNYLNNKDLLEEIHKSKASYSAYARPEYHQYDMIVASLDDINDEAIATAKQNKAKRLAVQEADKRKLLGEKAKAADFVFDVDELLAVDLVYRIMTYDHIPKNYTRKKNPRTVADAHDKINFPPFQHWKFNDEGQLVCVGKSHWRGDVETGKFSLDTGKISNKLASMYMKLCERYATHRFVRGFSYNDEMRGQALLQLTLSGLRFDESKGDNPFSYLTSLVTNSFARVKIIERKNQLIRDQLLESHGMSPSYSRLASADFEAGVRRDADY